MFKIEGIKIVCSFFLYRREKPKLKTAKQACGGARGKRLVFSPPSPPALWTLPGKWRPRGLFNGDHRQCPLHLQVVLGKAPKSPWITRALLDKARAAGYLVSMPLKVLALCPQTKKEGLLILGEKRPFSLNQKAQLSKAKANHGSFT